MNKAIYVGIALAIRVLLFVAGAPARLGRSIEVATPITSIFRLAEGFWLKQLGLSPYAGSAFHGSPLLLEFIGPIINKSYVLFLVADMGTALLILRIGRILTATHELYNDFLELPKSIECTKDKKLDAGELAAILYLLNPFTIVACVGNSTSPIENFIISLALYAAVAGNTPLAAFAWIMASHISMYPIVLSIPIVLALVYGPDKPSPKLTTIKQVKEVNSSHDIRWRRLWSFLLWSAIWSSCVWALCTRILHQNCGLTEMLTETYGFILEVKDLTPNIGLYWYFFTEVFEFYRRFFLMVFHGNMLCMIAPLSICFHHRPIFLSFIMVAIISTLKSYPSVGDAALYLGLMGLFIHELSEFKYTFLLLNGYICVILLGPVMFNLWIWRGTGNANFYFATALAYALVQIILVVESINTMLRYDRSLKLTLKSKNSDNPVEKASQT